MTLQSSSVLQPHLDAFLLAAASSTDNFMVGISTGLTSPSSLHFYKVNLAVALCNACGTLLATYGGDTLKKLPELALMKLAAAVSTSSSPETYRLNFSIEALLAAMAFAYLSWKEYSSEELDDEDDKRKKTNLSYSIALPMTLNNLAGGVAGGVLGLSAFQATFYAFLVSFLSMALGHFLGNRVVMMQQNSNSNAQETKSSTTGWCKYVAISIYVALCFQSLAEI
jgi:putative Mn2+ efflux pump MntP